MADPDRMDAESVLRLISARVWLQHVKLTKALTPDDNPDQWEDEKIIARHDAATVEIVQGILKDGGWWNLAGSPEPQRPVLYPEH